MAERGSTGNMVRQTPARPASGNVPQVNVRQLTEAVITALTEWNASALELLAREASSWIEDPPAPHLLAASADQHRLLGSLLHETEQNLRMFRETSPCVEFHSGTGAYESRWSY